MAADVMTKLLLLASVCFALAAGFASKVLANEADLPPNAVPGRCYQKVLIPEVLESYDDRVIDTLQRTETRVIPAVYADDIRQTVIREARTEYIDIPATYRTVTEVVTVRPAGVRYETIPARYETIAERVMVREAYTVWKRGVAQGARHGYPTRMGERGEILCLVEVPAEYAMVTRQVLREPARQVRIDVPAQTRAVARQVVDQPARVETRQIPAQYGQETVRVLKVPERIETYTVPATYRTVRKQRVAKAARFEWVQAVCDTPPPPPPPKYVPPPRPGSGCDEVDVTARTVRDLQTALGIRHYYAGARNGVFNKATRAALRRYQAENRLAVGRIDGPTLRAIGVPYDSVCAVGERG